MTADAKVGLLLGLFFIAIIAFLVNGLPNFIRQEHPTVADAAIRTNMRPDMVLDPTVNEVVHRLNPPREPVPAQPTQTPVEMTPTTPSTPAVVFTPPEPKQEVSIQGAIPETPVVINNHDLNDLKPEPIVEKTQTHTVKSGEMLSTIAKIYYGEDEGNRLAVIKKLFEANKAVLSSPDKVKAGDTLVVPSWEKLMGIQKPAEQAAPRQTVQAPEQKTTSPLQQIKDLAPKAFGWVGESEKESFTEYMVQQNDSLWSIAQKKLGDGNRYKEIARLNKITNVNTVPHGVRLKIPPK